MAVKRKFHFPMSTLLYEADLIITATEGQPAFATKRLPKDFVSGIRGKLTDLGGEASTKQARDAKTGDLTKEQNDAIVEMLDLFGKAKESAKRAFPAQKVKLHQEFQVGVQEPNDLGSVLGRARTVLASAKTEANAAALEAKGWIAEDTANFEAFIKQVGDIDKAQQDSESIKITGTDDRNTAANALYDDLLTIQNAANIEWSDKDHNNRGTRDSFRFDTFPPKAAETKAAPPSGPGGSSSTASKPNP
jgi:hypothetical protein